MRLDTALSCEFPICTCTICSKGLYLIPDILVEVIGKEGFAKCYELEDLATGKVTAGKIVSKSLHTKSHQKEKMSQEKKVKFLHYSSTM